MGRFRFFGSGPKTTSFDEQIVALDQKIAAIAGKIAEMDESLREHRQRLEQNTELMQTIYGRFQEEARTNDMRHKLNVLNYMGGLSHRSKTQQMRVADPLSHSIDEGLCELQRRAPLNFSKWCSLADAAGAEYQKQDSASLAVSWHPGALMFRQFLKIHAAGRILDIGAGPLAMPTYLAEFDPACLAGLDPLAPYNVHPFPFARSVAEFIPWPDESFETIVAATSLDHVYLLDVAMAEVSRVLTRSGAFIIWTGLFPETEPYDPYSSVIEPPDDYHLFHPGENWFPQFLARWFKPRDRFDYAPSNVFLAMEKI